MKIAITLLNAFLLYMPMNTVYQHYFTSFVDTLRSTALHTSFHQMLVVENYQIKFPL